MLDTNNWASFSKVPSTVMQRLKENYWLEYIYGTGTTNVTTDIGSRHFLVDCVADGGNRNSNPPEPVQLGGRTANRYVG